MPFSCKIHSRNKYNQLIIIDFIFIFIVLDPHNSTKKENKHYFNKMQSSQSKSPHPSQNRESRHPLVE
ncbi:hypothetical protein XBKQ1_2150073 [Xenorhabdus bovienii str. kraussei Quebec]|uniref:Uncharacterized protein n=1 Tax=Xenorhabdus bovienii str. kraussei Quebec TaxID=1398203 RepID=A0A077PFY0_XENBV|nr:hypothetical protein XBKQ1_2150073 [Xenorhabdus bovienii str. kraussei Quebec]